MKRERTGRLIVNVYDGIVEWRAMELVCSVIARGKVSADGASYCYGTFFPDGFYVSTDKPRSASPLTHTFYVYSQGGGAA